MVIEQRSPLGVLQEFADLYRFFAAHLGFTPRQVDAMEVWEAAVLMGRDRPSERPAVLHTIPVSWGEGRPGSGGSADSMMADIAARRFAAVKAGAPQPTWG